MTPALIDSHCHLEDERFADDRDAVIARMKDAGVSACILAGSDRTSSARVAALTERYDCLYGAVGVHPEEAAGFDEDILAQMTEWLILPRIVAVGEIGLDYHWDTPSREIQRAAFERQTDFAWERGVPAVFHVREAHGDALDAFRARKGRLPRGVLHCFSGSVESAREYLDMGFYLGFDGPLTFKNARNLPEVARYAPPDRILVETDSPYLAPEPVRGRRNEPAYVRYIAEKIAQIKAIPLDALMEQTTENVKKLYGI